MQWKVTRQTVELQLTINETEGRRLAAELEHYRREAGLRWPSEVPVLLQLYTALAEADWA